MSDAWRAVLSLHGDDGLGDDDLGGPRGDGVPGRSEVADVGESGAGSGDRAAGAGDPGKRP